MEKNIWVGCSGWSYTGWRDTIYKGVAQKDFFKTYTQHFNTVEINNTFYKFPDVDVIKKWKDDAPDGFIYTIKAPRLISHAKTRFTNTSLLNNFYDNISLLEDKLGCVLFQLPPYLEYSKKTLDDIITNINYDYRNVIEFRNESWWNNRVYARFRENKIIFCNISGPIEKVREGEIHHTADDLYLRFHGLDGWYDYEYNEEEISVWTDVIKKKHSTYTNLWVYFNNVKPVYNALKFDELIRE